MSRRTKKDKSVTKGIDPELLKRLNAMPCQPPRRCPRCGEKLHYWVNREQQEKTMKWPVSGIKYIFCCPKCGRFNV